MKNLLLITVIILSMFACNKAPKSEYKLVWSDEFDYTGLPDATKWSFDTAGNAYGWGNRELQFYTFEDIDNAEVSEGTLKIIARKEDFRDRNYTSARLRTKEKGDWLYGKFEIRAKLPDGVGMWPAIWMLSTDWEYGGWPESGEIDIMENVGFDPYNVLSTIHTKSFNHTKGTQKNDTIQILDNREQFHVYGLEWDSVTVKGLLDDEVYFTFNRPSDNPDEWPFNKRFHLLLNVAVGGTWGGMQGVDDNAFPATMEIDYVRVYQKQ